MELEIFINKIENLKMYNWNTLNPKEKLSIESNLKYYIVNLENNKNKTQREKYAYTIFNLAKYMLDIK